MRDKGSAVVAILLIVLGGYLLAVQLGIDLPGWGQIWPVLPLGAGIALLVSLFWGRGRDPGKAFLGTAAILVGLVFFFVTLGPLTYRDLGDWWPVFVLIAGVSFLAQWMAARFRDWGALFLAIFALVLGGATLAARFEVFGPDTQELLPQLWPALIILLGFFVLLRAIFGKRSW